MMLAGLPMLLAPYIAERKMGRLLFCIAQAAGTLLLCHLLDIRPLGNSHLLTALMTAISTWLVCWLSAGIKWPPV